MDDTNNPIRLLLVDNDVDFVDASAKALSRRGFAVERALDGASALRLLEATPCDAVVLSLELPRTGGLDVAHDLGMRWPGLPVIVLAGPAATAESVEWRRTGAVQSLLKPCDVDILAETVRRAVTLERNSRVPVSVDVGARGIRLLLVDDEPEYVQSLAKALRRRGMEVSAATCGTDALSILTRQVFDVAVLDVKMPGMDGVDLLAKVRQQYPQTQVILLTGHPTLDLALAGMEKGAFDYLLKPQAVEALTLAIVCAAARASQPTTASRT